MKYRHKAICLSCNHSDIVHHDSKEDYQEVRVCPNCCGAFVDVWKYDKYFTGNKPSMTNRLDMPVTEKKRCSDLTEKQIVYLEQMINNYRNRNMFICRCDVERVLNMCDCSEAKQK